MLFQVPRTQDPNTQRVNPFNPDLSYLIMKMEGNAGLVMPPTGMLNQAVINDIRAWIQNGAVR